MEWPNLHLEAHMWYYGRAFFYIIFRQIWTQEQNTSIMKWMHYEQFKLQFSGINYAQPILNFAWEAFFFFGFAKDSPAVSVYKNLWKSQ